MGKRLVKSRKTRARCGSKVYSIIKRYCILGVHYNNTAELYSEDLLRETFEYGSITNFHCVLSFNVDTFTRCFLIRCITSSSIDKQINIGDRYSFNFLNVFQP